MAIAFDNNANNGGQSNVSSASFNITIGNGSNRGVFVTIHYAFQNVSINSVTFGGVSMNQVVAPIQDGNVDTAAVYYLKNPPSGSSTVAVNLSGTVAFLWVSVVSFSGVDQSTATSAAEAKNSSTWSGSPASISLTTVSANAWYLASIMDDPTGTAGTISAGDGQTLVNHIDSGGGEDTDSYKGPFAGANVAHTISFSFTSTGPNGVMTAVSIKPATATTHSLSALGAGT